jgi:tetratricopeptide (TPR) repeat protein
MLTASVPDVQEIQALVLNPEFKVRAPQADPGLIVSPLHVKTSDHQILMTWDGQTLQMHRPSITETILNGFVLTAEKAVTRFPKSAHAHTSLGIALLKRGDVDSAISALQRALELRPDDVLGQMTLADALCLKGHYQEAEEIYSRFLHGCTQERAALGFAASTVRHGQFDKAQVCLASALKNLGKSPAVHFMLGMVELKRGNLKTATHELREATHLDIRNPVYHHSLGIAYAVQGKYESAEAAFKAALSISPAAAETIHALGRVLADKGDPSEVISLLAPFVETHPSDIEARELLGYAYINVGRYSSGRNHLRHILQEHGSALQLEKHVALLNGLALGFLRDGQPKEAELAFKQAIKLGPATSSIPYENLGRLYLYHVGRADAAKDIMNVAKQYFPDAQSIRILLAISLEASEDPAAGIRELEPFWNNGCAVEGTFVCLGWLHQRLGNQSNAIAALDDGLTRFPESLPLFNNLAYTYLMAGQLEKALEVFKRLPKRAKPQPEFVATRGLLELWRGHETEGRQLYERAEELAVSEGRPREAINSITQKKHLELARFFLRAKEVQKAETEIEHGLKLRAFPMSFNRDLENLKWQVGHSAAL